MNLSKWPGRRRLPHPDAAVEMELVRQGDLKRAYRQISKSLKPVLAELAERSLNRLRKDKDFHKTCPEYAGIMAELNRVLERKKSYHETVLRIGLEGENLRYLEDKKAIWASYQDKVESLQDDYTTHCLHDMLQIVRNEEKADDGEATEDEDEDGTDDKFGKAVAAKKKQVISRSVFYVDTELAADLHAARRKMDSALRNSAPDFLELQREDEANLHDLEQENVRILAAAADLSITQYTTSNLAALAEVALPEPIKVEEDLGDAMLIDSAPAPRETAPPLMEMDVIEDGPRPERISSSKSISPVKRSSVPLSDHVPQPGSAVDLTSEDGLADQQSPTYDAATGLAHPPSGYAASSVRSGGQVYHTRKSNPPWNKAKPPMQGYGKFRLLEPAKSAGDPFVKPLEMRYYPGSLVNDPPMGARDKYAISGRKKARDKDDPARLKNEESSGGLRRQHSFEEQSDSPINQRAGSQPMISPTGQPYEAGYNRYGEPDSRAPQQSQGREIRPQEYAPYAQGSRHGDPRSPSQSSAGDPGSATSAKSSSGPLSSHQSGSNSASRRNTGNGNQNLLRFLPTYTGAGRPPRYKSSDKFSTVEYDPPSAGAAPHAADGRPSPRALAVAPNSASRQQSYPPPQPSPGHEEVSQWQQQPPLLSQQQQQQRYSYSEDYHRPQPPPPIQTQGYSTSPTSYSPPQASRSPSYPPNSAYPNMFPPSQTQSRPSQQQSYPSGRPRKSPTQPHARSNPHSRQSSSTTTTSVGPASYSPYQNAANPAPSPQGYNARPAYDAAGPPAPPAGAANGTGSYGYSYSPSFPPPPPAPGMVQQASSLSASASPQIPPGQPPLQPQPQQQHPLSGSNSVASSPDPRYGILPPNPGLVAQSRARPGNLSAGSRGELERELQPRPIRQDYAYDAPR
jgi:hypothetical protein